MKARLALRTVTPIMRKSLGAMFALVLMAAGQVRSDSSLAAQDDAPVFVGAGDIADCEDLAGARLTANLLDGVVGTIFTLGDHVYPSGSAKEFRDCYGPTWGRHKARTHPTIGNHDLKADNGQSYFEYFGANAGPKGRGYYSFDLGTWHIVSLNSSAPSGSHSPQVRWLREDLSAHPNDCVLAYWHVPRYSSGAHGGSPVMAEVWHVLYEAGADVVLNGHEHSYERFAPQSDKGKPDPDRGIREFVVGTGGGEPDRFGRISAGSEVHKSGAHGVLKLTLSPGRYTWEFIPVSGQEFRDSGSAACSPMR